MTRRTGVRFLRPLVAIAMLAAVLPIELARAEPATSVAVFGDNQIDDHLSGDGFSTTLVTDAQLATAGFLEAFDVFVYTRDGDSTPGPSLSAGAAANVAAFVDDGRGVLLNGDFADAINPDFVATPDAEVGQLLSNAVAWAATSGHGYVGEYSGAVAGLTSNADGLTALGFVDGAAAQLHNGAAVGSIEKTAVGQASPVLTGVDLSHDPEQLEFGATITGVNAAQVLAVYESGGNPAVIGFDHTADVATGTVNVTTPSGVPASTVYANGDDAENTVTYAVVVRNDGPAVAESVVLDVEVPAPLSDAEYCLDDGTPCAPDTAFPAAGVSLGTLAAGASETVRVAARADASLRDGPYGGLQATATASSDTTDPNLSNNAATADAVTIATVADPPSTATAIAGNGNAVVYWPPVGAADDGGSAVTGYEVTTVAQGGGAEPGPFTVPPDAVDTTQFGLVVQARVPPSGAGLTNGATYTFEVRTLNDVGAGDPATSNAVTPDATLSAEILSGAGSQSTGAGAVGNNDAVIGKQSGTFDDGTIGTLQEITGANNPPGIGASPSTFCGDRPCAGGTIILNKLTDPTDSGRYLIEIHYAKQVPIGTGQKRVYFDPVPDDAQPAEEIFRCPKKGEPLPDACIRKLVANTSQNPAVLVQISVRNTIIDPLSGTRR